MKQAVPGSEAQKSELPEPKTRKIGKLEARVWRVEIAEAGGLSAIVARLGNFMESLTSKDDRDTVVEFSKKFRVTDKAAFGYSFAGMSNEFLVTLFESEKGTKLMHVDFRSTGEDHDTKRAYSHLLENRMDFEVIKAGIEYRNELEAYVTENSAQWKDKRVKLPASTFFSKDQDKTSTHSEPYFVTEVPLPFIPKFVRLTNEEAEAKKSLEELSFDLGRTLREYESKAATLRDALNADAFAEEAVASVSVH